MMMVSSGLPVTLLAFLLASPALASTRTSSYDPFRALAAHAPRHPDPPVCRLQPLPAQEAVEDDMLLSFEEWKAKQFAMQEQARARAREKEVANRSVHAQVAVGGANSATGNKSESTAITFETLLPAGPDSILVPQDIPGGQLSEMMSPHFRVPITDRFNYASLDCSARVHSSHRLAKSPSAILSSTKDKYMLSPCSSSKHEQQFVIVELCDDIHIDTVQLANFEFFSGVFKDFTVSVAKTSTDPTGWIDAGTFRAKNVRGVQSFHPPPSLRDFYRYIRIDFHSHYGNEYYCPVSLLRVYGLTHLEHWKWDLWEAESREKLAHLNVEASRESMVSSTAIVPAELVNIDGEHSHLHSDTPPTEHTSTSYLKDSTGTATKANSTGDLPQDSNHQTGVLVPSVESTRPLTWSPSPTPVDMTSTLLDSGVRVTSTLTCSARSEDDRQLVSATSDMNEMIHGAGRHPRSAVDGSLHMVSESSGHGVGPSIEPTPSPATYPPQTASSSSASSAHTETSTRQPLASTISTTSTSSHSVLPSVGPPVPLLAGTAGGESIYRTIMNRLSNLESNHSLYMSYVEEQTSHVREVLRRLGEDVGRVEAIGKAQAQMYQRTLLEWERQKNRLDLQYGELLSRVDYLADEIMMEKRLGIAQLFLLLASLLFMGLTRGSRGETLIAHAPSSVFRKSVREWSRRNLNFSGEWVDRFRSQSRSQNTTPRERSPVRILESKDFKTGLPSQDSPPRRKPLRPSQLLNIDISAASSGRITTPLVSTPIRRQLNSGHHRMASSGLGSGVRPRLQSAGSIPSEFAFGLGSAAPRSARKWARSAHLHEVKADGTRSAVKVKRPDGSWRSKVARENVNVDVDDAFGVPGVIGEGGAGQSRLLELQPREALGSLTGVTDKMDDGDVWVDTDVEPEVDADISSLG